MTQYMYVHQYVHDFKYRVCLVVSVSASHTVGRGFRFLLGHTKVHHKKWYKLPPCMAYNALGWNLAVQPDCLKGQVACGTVYGNMHLKDLLGSIVRVGFLSSATWPSLAKKHYNGLTNQSFNQSC